tara:strand:+ start:1269 stop:2027 length:759 start_codon:yes stop_codon:yes gene_type:complete
MFELVILLLLIFILSFVQSIIGVGVLVLGTPILLILKYDMISILSILLPISIFTSLINIILMKKNMNNVGKILNKKTKSSFYFFCIPSILVGLLLLKIFQNRINFEILISSLILISVLIKHYYQNRKVHISNYIKKLIFSLIGLIHGLTNSGGTLLSLFVSFSEKNFKINSRYIITYFYLILASSQFSLFLFIFWEKIIFNNTYYILIITLIGCFMGNYIIKYINEYNLKSLVEIAAIISSVFLFINGINQI